MEHDRIRTAVIGASGYSGEELIRLLLRHPDVAITCVTSRKYAGQPVARLFPRFAEADLVFSEPDAARVAHEADVVFLALPHGLACDYAVPLLEAGAKVIDISADFRLKNPATYKQYYRQDHPAPHLLERAVYGLPERYRNDVKEADLVACPGCYPTSVILPLYPLLEQRAIAPEGVSIISMSGVTGAGRKVDLPYIFPECNESVRPYAVTGHRHLPEIEQELSAACGGDAVTVSFLPHLIPVNRGIHSTILARLPQDAGAPRAENVLREAYRTEPFVRVLPEGALADTKHVTHTNVEEIGIARDERTGQLIVSSAVDNLTKGAAGQAVQCMNIMCGCDEKAGLTA